MQATMHDHKASPGKHGVEQPPIDRLQFSAASADPTGDQRRRLVTEATLLFEELQRRVQQKRRPRVQDAA
jgi:hypothetical protein